MLIVILAVVVFAPRQFRDKWGARKKPGVAGG